MNAIPYGTSERTNMINDVYFGPKYNDNGNDISTEESRLTEINQLGVLFPEIYYGVAKERSRAYELNQTSRNSKEILWKSKANQRKSKEIKRNQRQSKESQKEVKGNQSGSNHKKCLQPLIDNP